MKKQNRTAQLALGASVLVIWGMVAYRFNRLNKGTNNQAGNAKFTVPEAIPTLSQDTFHLALDYQDPFLSVASSIAEKKTNATSVRTNMPIQTSLVKQPQSAPPSIQYKGFSRDTNGRIRARLAVNGKGMTVANGEVVGNLNVVSIFKDSVQIKWEGKKYTLRRQKSR